MDERQIPIGERLTNVFRTAQRNFLHIRSFMRVMGKRKSLIERIRLITAKCYPGQEPLPVFESIWGGDFELDLKRLERIDKRRHALIHHAEFATGHEDFEDDLEYCELTLTFLVKIVSLRFGIVLGDGQHGPCVEKLKATASLTEKP